MAHFRKRQIDEFFQPLMNFSPIVGIFGHRQVGKSTFVSTRTKRYWTLDDKETRLLIAENAKEFLHEQLQFPTTIDECQFEPDLFPALKEYVRTHKKPGQFILTGSVRFTSRKAIRESLAGRMVDCEMLPLILSELMASELPDTLPSIMGHEVFSESSLSLLRGSKEGGRVQKFLEKYLIYGGLPGLCFVHNDRIREEGLRSLHRLILDRDLRLIIETKLSLETLERFLRLIASQAWNPYNASEVRRVMGLSHQTQKNLLFALESIFLIRRIPLSSRSGETILFEDQYEERTLSNGKLARPDQILSALFRNSRAQFHYRIGNKASFESYWTRAGARVPLVIKCNSRALGLIVFEGSSPTLSQKRSADSFLRHDPTGKVLFLSDTPITPRILDSRALLCSAASII